jgi:Lsr2
LWIQSIVDATEFVAAAYSLITRLVHQREVVMARRAVIELADDLDNTPAAETVTFGLDGTQFEIDLSQNNAAKLREAVAPYVSVARTAN